MESKTSSQRSEAADRVGLLGGRPLVSLLVVCWRTGLVVLIVLGVLVGAARVALPIVGDQLRPELESWLGQRLGKHARVGELGLTWHGTGPALRLNQVQIDSRGAPPLRVEQVLVRLDVLRSLVTRKLQPSQLLILGTRLTVQRTDSGRLALVGGEAMAVADPAEAAVAALAWLMRLPHADVRQADLTLLDPLLTQGQVTFEEIALSVRDRPDGQRLGLDVELPDSLGGGLQVVLDTPGGDPDQPAGWPFRVYLKAEAMALQPLAELLGRPDPGPGRLDAELWLDLAAGQLIEANAFLSGTSAAGSAQMRLALRSSAVGWRLTADQLLGGSPQPGHGGELLAELTRSASGAVGWRVAGRGLHLEPLGVIAGWLPTLIPGAAKVPALRPRGVAESVAVSWQAGNSSTPPQLELDLRARNLSWRAVDGIPGINGLDLRATGNGKAMTVDLSGRNLALVYPRLFRKPLPPLGFDGRLEFRRVSGGWNLTAPQLSLQNRDLSARARLVAQGGPAGIPDYLDLQVSFTDVDAASARDYYPVGIMKPKLRNWLQRAVVAGTVPSGVMVFRGRPREFPFRSDRGRFLVRFGVEDGILDFSRKWPRLEQLVGEATFSAKDFQARILDGRLLDAQVESATVGVDRYRNATLQIAVSSDSDLPTLVDLLQATPLADTVGRRLVELGVDGGAALELEIGLPLKNPKATVDGAVVLENAAMSLPEWDLTLSAMEGAVAFTEAGLKAETVAARWRGQAVTLGADLVRRGETVAGSVQMAGESTLAELLPESVAALGERLRGQALWQAEGTLAAGRMSALQLTSSLQGVAVALPAPIGKAAAESKPVTVAIEPQASDQARVSVQLGDVGRAVFALRDYRTTPSIQGVGVQFGPGVVADPPDRGVRFDGHIPSLSVAPWLELWRALPVEGGETIGPIRGEVNLDKVSWGPWSVTQVWASLDGLGWRVAVEDQWVRGRISGGPSPQDALRADLERLWLPFSGTAASAELTLEPQALPPLRVEVADLRLGEARLGEASLESDPAGKGLALGQLILRAPSHQLTAAGSWASAGTRVSSRLHGEVVTTNLGSMVRDLGYRSGIAGAPGRITFDLAWPGSLISPELTSVAGRIDAAFGGGTLQKLEPGVGRLVGLINLNELSRRLALDFRDVQEAGFAFDSMTGEFRLAEGDAYTQNLTVTGPAARIEIVGRTGLVARDYEQEAYVTPALGSALPIAGALAGGPLVGAALLIAGEILRPGIERITRIEYRISGPWENPVIEPLRAEGLQGSGAEALPDWDQ